MRRSCEALLLAWGFVFVQALTERLLWSETASPLPRHNSATRNCSNTQQNPTTAGLLSPTGLWV